MSRNAKLSVGAIIYLAADLHWQLVGRDRCLHELGALRPNEHCRPWRSIKATTRKDG